MAVFRLTDDSIVPLEITTFAAQGIREREDLQRLLRQHIEAVAPDTYVLAEEYGEWEDARRRIDLLCIDRNANLVVIELKRTEDGGHMDLQAIRYAAMVSKMTFSQAEEAHAAYLQKIGSDEDARSAILHFLDWEEPRESEFAQEVRVVLVSGEFSKEITTSVMWLSEYDVDIRCVRLRPYTLSGQTLVDIQQVLPLQEATDYQVQLKKKAAEERQAKERGADWTRYDLHVSQQVFPSLLKRHLFFQVVKALIGQGVTPEQIMKHFPERKFIAVPSECDGDEFRQKAAKLKGPGGGLVDVRRFFIDDDELFVVNGKTYALTKMWSKGWLPTLDVLLAAFPSCGIRYEEAGEA
jgi:hypothetical protein